MHNSAQIDHHLRKKKVQAAIRRSMLVEGELPYHDFVKQLYSDLDEAIYILQKNPELHQNSSEDQLSILLLGNLKISGYDTAHEAKTGGHVDLTVGLGDYTWIGEAKKDGNYEGGFKQLSTRYVTGSGNYAHNHGGLIFYLVTIKNAKLVMNNWRAKLIENSTVCKDCKNNTLAFYSDHVLESSGTDFYVRSMAVSLYHQPQDASGIRTAENAAAKKTAAKKTAAKKTTAKKTAAKKSSSE